MKHRILSTGALALATIFSLSPAFAADLDKGGDPTSANYVESDRPNFTGFYLGGRIGYGNANHDLTVERYNGGYCYDPAGPGTAVPEGFDPTAPEYGVAGNIPALGCPSDVEVPHIDDTFAVAPPDKDIANLDGVNSHGIIGGFQAGYDQQVGSRFIIGVFGTYDFSGMETTMTEGVIGIENPDVSLGLTSIEKGDEWSVGARAGLLVNPKTLVYILAAYTQTEYDFNGLDSNGDAFSKATTFDGVSVGGGIEFALTQNVFLGLEYVHTFYGEETVLDTGPSEVGGFGQKVIDDLDEDKVMATLKVKLNSGLGF